ncbi:molecular chaperone GrpE [Thermotoga sp. RQ7]|jgi:molecular chaperone GrpE|uniref:nucleotide exchange factor GrpE n=1 Tax=Thermotoga sp. RQ7 TaxID=126738 RepID=UPI0005A303C3|nr:nucleotide exchange factor GrpE [Thermotoga sp. RQ7]AJG39932.1 molecular chaperone GrpE [Thermotoga sp. RQ7]
MSEKEKKDLSQECEELKEKYRELEEYAKRLKAEYENYREEVAREKRELIKNANEYLISRLIPILDDFERALNQKDHEESFYKGVKLIYKKLLNTLEKEGLSKIQVGETFDPFEHEAVERVETDDVEEYTVLEVLESGYKFHGKVLKPAKVKVAVRPRKKDEESPDKKE